MVELKAFVPNVNLVKSGFSKFISMFLINISYSLCFGPDQTLENKLYINKSSKIFSLNVLNNSSISLKYSLSLILSKSVSVVLFISFSTLLCKCKVVRLYSFSFFIIIAL
ncbi:hypothetical protein EHP00_2708 [Ecytonucleospora hepatopenaei]|uniref:Uncharacterized protein n=1 Tax=Ecytonucleospora hepatopenaei TaxID=646526 RepID=A0A1W0E7U9_9MICR|nr:hypothetical protein EHP00_2708 [Ecytonucleospora hepatopenaei]